MCGNVKENVCTLAGIFPSHTVVLTSLLFPQTNRTPRISRLMRATGASSASGSLHNFPHRMPFGDLPGEVAPLVCRRALAPDYSRACFSTSAASFSCCIPLGLWFFCGARSAVSIERISTCTNSFACVIVYSAGIHIGACGATT
jgi:hypothetical protein